MPSPSANPRSGHTVVDAELPVLARMLHRLHPATCVVHVGTGQGLGTTHLWRQWAVPHALLLDAAPEIAPWLTTALQQNPDWRASADLVAAAHQTLPWHSASNPAESGLLPPVRLQSIWPGLQTLQTELRPAQPLDAVVATHLPDTPPNWLVIDCLPALPVLQGATATLARCDVVWLRLVLEPLPELQDASLQAVQALLQDQHFQWVAVAEGIHPALGEALFVRNSVPLLQSQIEQLQLQIGADTSTRHSLELQLQQTQQALGDSAAQIRQLSLEKQVVEQARQQAEGAHAKLQAQFNDEVQAKLEALAQQDRLRQQRSKLIADYDQLARARDQLGLEREAQEAAKAEALAQRNAEAQAKADAIAQRDTQAQRANELQTSLAALQAQCDQLAQEKANLIAAHAELASATAELTSQREAQAAATADAIAQRDIQAQRANELQTSLAVLQAQRDQLAQEKANLIAAHAELASAVAELTSQRQAQAAATADALAQRDALVNERNQLVAARDEQTQLATQHQQALTVRQQETIHQQQRITQLEAENHEYTVRQQMLQDEMIKAEAQIDLIKDLLLREPGL